MDLVKNASKNSLVVHSDLNDEINVEPIRKAKPTRPATAGWKRPVTNNLLPRNDSAQRARNKPPLNYATSISSLHRHFGALTKAASQNELKESRGFSAKKRFDSN